MNSPQGNTSSAGKGRSICLSAKTEHYTCKYYNLPRQQAYMGRVPVHPGNTHKHTHTVTPTIKKQSLHLYTQMQCLWADSEHTQVVFTITVGIFAGRL